MSCGLLRRECLPTGTYNEIFARERERRRRREKEGGRKWQTGLEILDKSVRTPRTADDLRGMPPLPAPGLLFTVVDPGLCDGSASPASFPPVHASVRRGNALLVWRTHSAGLDPCKAALVCKDAGD